ETARTACAPPRGSRGRSLRSSRGHLWAMTSTVSSRKARSRDDTTLFGEPRNLGLALSDTVPYQPRPRGAGLSSPGKRDDTTGPAARVRQEEDGRDIELRPWGQREASAGPDDRRVLRRDLRGASRYPGADLAPSEDPLELRRAEGACGRV